MANKKNPDRINKDCIIRVRVTKEEYDNFKQKAYKGGYKSISDYVRTLATEEHLKSDVKTGFLCLKN